MKKETGRGTCTSLFFNLCVCWFFFFFFLPCEIFQVAFMSWFVQTSLSPHPTSLRHCVCMIVRMNGMNVSERGCV